MTEQADAAQPLGDFSESEIAQRLELIGALPLVQRASGFSQLHDELLTELERSDQPRSGAREAGEIHA